MMQHLIVTLNDIRAIGFCNKGARVWFDRHGLDWHDFVKNGIDETTLEATGDAMALRAISQARRRVVGDQ